MWRIFMLLSIALVSSQKCRVLSIGGGTEKGPYSAGVISGLIEGLPQGEAEWDVITGLGDGAYNAYIMAQYSKGQESEGADQLIQFWSSFTRSDFLIEWPGQYIQGLFFESGLYDSTPLKETIEKTFIGFQKFLSVGAADLVSGGYVIFNTTLESTIMKEGVLASSSFDGTFPYIQYGDWKLVSGFLKFSVDIFHGVDYCIKQGFAINNIVVDTILSEGHSIEKVDVSNYKTLQNLRRYLEILSYNWFLEIVDNIVHDYPDIVLRSKVFPTVKLPSGGSLPFDYTPQEITTMINQGKTDGKAAASQVISFEPVNY